MFTLIVPRHAPSLDRAGPLVDGDGAIDRALACTRGALARLPWPFPSDHLAVRVVQTLARLAAGCPRAYALRRLEAVVPAADARARVLAALTADDGPLLAVEGAAFARADAVTARADGVVSLATLDEDMAMEARYHALLAALPRDATAPALRAAAASSALGADAGADVLAWLVEAGLLRPRAGRPLTLDPRARVHFAWPEGARDTAWVDDALAAADAARGHAFAPALELVAPLPPDERAATRLVEALVRLRHHLFDDAACALLHDPAAAPSDAALDRLATLNRRVRASLRVLTVVRDDAPPAALAVARAAVIARRLGATSRVVWDAPVALGALGALDALAAGGGVTLGPRAGGRDAWREAAARAAEEGRDAALGCLVDTWIAALRCREGGALRARDGRLAAGCALAAHLGGASCGERDLGDASTPPGPHLARAMPSLSRPPGCL